MTLEENLISMGYTNLRQTKSYGLIGTFQYMFTYGLIIDLNEYDYSRRYCYQTIDELRIGYKTLLVQDQMEKPPLHVQDQFWIKCKGTGYDLHNPNNPKLQNEIVNEPKYKYSVPVSST